MSSVALSGVRRPRTLTDRRNDITTVKLQPSPAGLTSPDVASETPRTIDLLVECGDEVRRVRFSVPSVTGPDWLFPTILRAGKLLSLPHDWDRQGAPPVDSTMIQTAIDVLSVFMRDNSSLPQWTPTQQAGVQLDWHESGIDLEIAFEPGEVGGHVVFSDRNLPEAEWDGPVHEHFEELLTLFRGRLAS
jgi:hypothetical protein